MFWSDKTEVPTPRRREEARKRGIVPRSGELTGAIVLLCGIIAGIGLLPQWLMGLQKAIASFLTQGQWEALVWEGLGKPFLFMVGLMAIGMLTGALQTKFLFTLHPLKADWQKVNPLSGLKRMISFMAFWDALRLTLKAFIIGGIGFVVLKDGLGPLIGTANANITASVATVGTIALRLLGWSLLALLALAALDYAMQWWRVEMSLRMTRHELKEELRHTEGDPNIKARLRRHYRQLVLNRQIYRVKEATVVVTNPTRLAVALCYEPKGMPAPKVIAKGSDWMARRIIAEAQRYSVPIIPDAPLAQALFKLPVGATIPPELYHAVAEVIAFVYRITGRTQEVLGEA